MKSFFSKALYCQIFILFSTTVQTWAADTSPSNGPRFGPEFTFAPFGDLNRDQGFDQYLLHLEQHLIDNQKNPAKFKLILQENADINNPYTHNRFRSPLGWQFHAKKDNGVIEVTMNPMSVDEFEKHKDSIQDAIFQSAYNLDFFASLYEGGGHINIDGEYFADEPLFFRNFMADLLNHNELSLGILNYDTHNALPIELLTDDSIHKIKEAFKNFDASPGGVSALHQLIRELNAAIYYSRDDFNQLWTFPDEEIDYRGKYTAVNFSNLLKNEGFGRIELRSVRAQMDIETWIKQIRLLKNRISYIKSIKDPIPYKPSFSMENVRKASIHEKQEYKLSPPVDPQKALMAFYHYVTESGEAWADHQDYLWPQWITNGELDKFNKELCNKLMKGAAS